MNKAEMSKNIEESNVRSQLPGQDGRQEWDKDAEEKRPDLLVVPPPVWTRYIESRLKEFCTR